MIFLPVLSVFVLIIVSSVTFLYPRSSSFFYSDSNKQEPLSLHRHSHIGLVLTLVLSINNKNKFVSYIGLVFISRFLDS